MGIQRCSIFTIGLILLVACGPQQSSTPVEPITTPGLPATAPAAQLGNWGVVLDDRVTSISPGCSSSSTVTTGYGTCSLNAAMSES